MRQRHVERVDDPDPDVREEVPVIAPVDLGLGTRDDLEPAVQPRERVLVLRREFGGDPRPSFGQEHLHPLVGAGETVLGDQPLMDHRPLQADVSAQPRLGHAHERHDHLRLAAGPRRSGAGGTEGASSARYFLTVRQSTPHSRPISA